MSSNAIHPSHPLSCPSPLALDISPASGSFPVSQLFTSGGQSIGALASVLQMNIQGWFPLGLTRLITLLSRDSQESSPVPWFKSINSLCTVIFMVKLSHPYMTTGKTIALTIQTFVGKVMSLLFNTLGLYLESIRQERWGWKRLQGWGSCLIRTLDNSNGCAYKNILENSATLKYIQPRRLNFGE